MANKYCNLVGTNKIKDDWPKVNTGFDRVETDTTSLQQQITTNELDIEAKLQQHKTTSSAHTAEQIAYASNQSVKTKLDAQQTQINNIVGQTGSSNTEIVDGRMGADGVARSTIGTLMREMHADLLQSATEKIQLTNGYNIVHTSQGGPVVAAIQGRTLVNLLGSDGKNINKINATNGANTRSLTTDAAIGTSAIEVSAANAAWTRTYLTTTNCEPGKYYLFVFWLKKIAGTGAISVYLRKNNFVSGSIFASKVQLTNTDWVQYGIKFVCPAEATDIKFCFENSTQDTNYRFDGLALYEIDSETYAKIDIDPEYTGDKLAARYPYVDGVQHLTNPVITKRGENLLPPFTEWTLHANASVVEPYRLELNTTITHSASKILIDIWPNQIYTFTTPDLTATANYYDLIVRDKAGSIVGSVYGIQRTRTFMTPATACKMEAICLNGTTTGRFIFENAKLELGSVATPFEPQNNDYLYAETTLAGYGGVNDVLTVQGPEATVLRNWRTDVPLDGSLAWESTFTSGPNWKVVKIASLLPTPASSGNGDDDGRIFMQKNSMPLRNDDGAITDWTAGGIFRYHNTGLHISVATADSGWGDSFTPSTPEIKAYFNGWRMNNGTFGQPYNGSGTKTWTRWNATNNTGAVTTVPTTMAEGYTPYKLSYQLATPITEVVPIEGALANHAGNNLYELGEGVIVRERVHPVIYDATMYINDTNLPASKLKNRAYEIIQVYRDSKVDLSWRLETGGLNSYGRAKARLPAANFDPTAEYTVTYLAMDKYTMTANATEARLEYASNPRSSIERISQAQADATTAITIHDWILAEHTARLLALEEA